MLKILRSKVAYIYLSIIVVSIFSVVYLENKLLIYRGVAYALTLSFYYSVYLNRNKFNFIKRLHEFKENPIYFCYLIVSTILLAITIYDNSNNIITLLFNPLSFLAFFIGIIGFNIGEYEKTILIHVCRLVNNSFPVFLVIDFLFFDKPVISREVSLLLILELFICSKISMKRSIYLVLVAVVFFIGENFYDNRTSALRGLVLIVIYLFTDRFTFIQSKMIKTILFLVSIVFFCSLTFYFKESFEIIAKNLSGIKNINLTDTRTFLFIEFFQDFKNSDWIAGRGYLGTYFSQYFLDWDGVGGDSYQRFSVEVGALDILLKGGLLLVVPFFLILLNTLWIGFFRVKKSKIVFRLTLFILLEFVLFSIENIPMFGVHFMVLWLVIGITRYESEVLINIK